MRDELIFKSAFHARLAYLAVQRAYPAAVLKAESDFNRPYYFTVQADISEEKWIGFLIERGIADTSLNYYILSLRNPDHLWEILDELDIRTRSYEDGYKVGSIHRTPLLIPQWAKCPKHWVKGYMDARYQLTRGKK